MRDEVETYRRRSTDADELNRRLDVESALLVLDVRWVSAFEQRSGIPSVAPLALDRDPILLPDVARELPIGQRGISQWVTESDASK